MKDKHIILFISLAFMGCLLLLSLLFAKERIIFMDNAFQTFLLVNNKNIEIMAQRYPAAVVRILPYLGVKLNLDLGMIVRLFSISYVLVQFGIAFLAHVLIRDKKWLIAVCLSLALVTGNSFFWCNTELAIAIPMSILILGLVVENYRRDRLSRSILLTIGGGILLMFYHPQSLLCFLFGVLFLMQPDIKKVKTFILPALAMVVLAVKMFVFKNWYDAVKFVGLKNNLKELFPNYLSTDSFMDFYGWLPDQLLLISVVFLATTIILIYRKKWYHVILIVFGSLANLTLFHLTNSGSMTVYYAEAGYLVWAGLVAIAFTFGAYEKVKHRSLVYGLILITCVFKIFIVSGFYSERLVKIEAQVEKHKSGKVIISQSQLPKEYFELNWALAFETLLMSNIQDKSTSTTVVGANSAEEYSDFMDGKKMINGLGAVVSKPIDTSYFKWTESPYELDYK